MDYRLFSPEALSAVIARLFKARKRQKSCVRAVDGPPARLAQIVDASPQELSGDIAVVRHCQPVLKTVAVFAAQKRLVGILYMMRCIQIFFVIVTRNVDGIKKAKICRKLWKCSRERHRVRGVHGPHEITQMFCHGCQTLGIGAQGIVEMLGFWLVGVVVACHFVKAWMAVRVIRVVNLVADTPQNDTRMIAVAPYHIGEIALMPDRKVRVVTFMPWGIDIVPLPPFVFGTFPLVKRLVNHKKA